MVLFFYIVMYLRVLGVIYSFCLDLNIKSYRITRIHIVIISVSTFL